LRDPDLVSVKIDSVQETSLAANIDGLIYDQRSRDKVTVTSEAPHCLSGVDVNGAKSPLVRIKSHVSDESRGRV
jgi:hypothetical protein